jgi:phytoene synthase
MEDLKQFDVPAADLLNGRESENFKNLLAFEAARARQYYEKAFASLPQGDRRTQRPGLIMAAIYRTLLDEIERDGFRVLKTRTSLTPLRKFWLAWKTWVSA